MTSPSYGMYSGGQGQAKSRNARLIQQHNMMSSMFVDRGLLNKPGENNCFLNSAIQVCVYVHILGIAMHIFRFYSSSGIMAH